jgi:GT2 family glycosyltransferase
MPINNVAASKFQAQIVDYFILYSSHNTDEDRVCRLGEKGSMEATHYPIGVVIPTYNRSDVLVSCLQHLERQTRQDFEVVVVDDGSTDSTRALLEEYQRETPLHLRIIHQNNSGPARARNVAASALHAPICLMIGDDILASPWFVSTHLELHRTKPAQHVVGLGLTRWCDSGQTVTAFMRWLEDSGLQFAYKELLDGARPNWKHFYTSNLSMKTQFLLENPFNESFAKAAAEDTELGYRLEQQRGLEVVFVPDALAHHLHPTNFRQACRRNITVGKSTRLFHVLWPDAAPPTRHSPLALGVRRFILKNRWLLPPLTILAEVATTISCPNVLMLGTLSCYFRIGYEEPALSSQELRKGRT